MAYRGDFGYEDKNLDRDIDNDDYDDDYDEQEINRTRRVLLQLHITIWGITNWK